ncbi:MAG: DUF6498-containing protein [Chitinophagaceae bacterium]
MVATIFSLFVKRNAPALPVILMLVLTNAIPVYGAWVGKLLFFQLIYLFWLEGFILIVLDDVKIMTARGEDKTTGGLSLQMLVAGAIATASKAEHWSFFKRLWVAIKSSILKSLVLFFYLLFIIVFIGLQVTDKSRQVDVWQTIALKNDFFNFSLATFAINAVVQLILMFFLNGRYKTESPHLFTFPINGRIIFMHVMIVGSVFIQISFFKGKTYEAKGEVVYVGLFMLIKALGDWINLRSRLRENPSEEVHV